VNAVDPRLLEILVCPSCKGPLEWRPGPRELVCRGERLAYPERDGIPVLLEDEARALGPQEVQL
jgi:uncharacterized protein YbaR (Trm112 family)